jgi:hypothetical protein
MGGTYSMHKENEKGVAFLLPKNLFGKDQYANWHIVR